jgi:hypothetical protein
MEFFTLLLLIVIIVLLFKYSVRKSFFLVHRQELAIAAILPLLVFFSYRLIKDIGKQRA